MTQAPSDPLSPPSLGIPDIGSLMGASNTMQPSSGPSFDSFVPQPPQSSSPTEVPHGEVVTLSDLFSGSGFTGPSNSGNSQPSFTAPEMPTGNNGIMRTGSVPQPDIQFGSSLRNLGGGSSSASFSSTDGFSSAGKSRPANQPRPTETRTLGADGFQSRSLSQSPSSSFGSAGTPNIATNMLDSQRSFTPPTSPFSGSAGFGASPMGSPSGFPSGPSPSSPMGMPSPLGFPEPPPSPFGRPTGMDSRGSPTSAASASAAAAAAAAAATSRGPTFLGGSTGFPSIPPTDRRSMPTGMEGMGGMPGMSSMSGMSSMGPFGSSAMSGDRRFGSPMDMSVDPRPDMRLAEVRPDIRRFMGSSMGGMEPVMDSMSRFSAGGMPTGTMPRGMMGPMGPRMPGTMPGMSPFMPGMPPFMRSGMPPFMMRGGMGFRRRIGLFR